MTDPKLIARRTVRAFLESMADANERNEVQRTPEARAEIVRLFRAAANFVDAGGELPPKPSEPVVAVARSASGFAQ